jgi:hypothetical protein
LKPCILAGRPLTSTGTSQSGCYDVAYGLPIGADPNQTATYKNGHDIGTSTVEHQWAVKLEHIERIKWMNLHSIVLLPVYIDLCPLLLQRSARHFT